MVDQLTTTAAVKLRLGITDSTDDALISSMIDGVSDWIADLTGRQLAPTSNVTYVVDTARGSAIDVTIGIRAVDELGVASSDQPDTGGTYAAIDAADILLRPAGLDRRPGWPATRIVIRGPSARLYQAINGARIVGDFGFAAVPPAIAEAALDAVVAAYSVRRQGAGGVIGAEDNATVPWSLFFGAGSPQMGLLLRYRGPQGVA